MSNEMQVELSKDKASVIKVPKDISEQSRISGYAFSGRLLKEANIQNLKISAPAAKSKRAFSYASLIRKITSDSSGGPTIGENSVTIWVDDIHANAGSTTDYIWMYFGPDKRLKLHSNGFPKGTIFTADLNIASSFLETVPTDAWDDIALVSDSVDGILIKRIKIKHSSVTILDWNCNAWLDESKLESHGKLVLTAKILSTKLSHIRNRWTPQIHWAARELGKTDGKKYGTTSAWCSEFASWCLRKALWDTPKGNINSQKLEGFFSTRGRMYTQSQLLAGDYVLTEGDYVRFQWATGGYHSGLFIKYISDPNVPNPKTKIRTIEGNVGSTVKMATREFRHILSIGNTR